MGSKDTAVRSLHHQRFRPVIPRPSAVLLRSPWLLAVGWISAAAFGVAAAFAHDWLLRLDGPVSEYARTHKPAGILHVGTFVGSPNTALVVGATMMVALWRRCRALALAFPATVVAGIAVDLVLKLVVDRPRPPMVEVSTALSSFPSGHVISAAIVFGLLPPALFILTRNETVFWAAVAAMVVAVPAVAYGRVSLGAHWPSDVVASILIGASLLLGAEYVLGSRFVLAHCPGCPLHREPEKFGVPGTR